MSSITSRCDSDAPGVTGWRGAVHRELVVVVLQILLVEGERRALGSLGDRVRVEHDEGRDDLA